MLNAELDKSLKKAYLFPNDPKKNASLAKALSQTNINKNLLNEFLILFYSNGESFDKEFKKIPVGRIEKIDQNKILEIQECLKFLKKHFQYAITLKIKPKMQTIVNEFRIFNFEISNKKILFQNFKEVIKAHAVNNQDTVLLDFVITKEKELKLGYKHYLLSEESSFVYSAGRMQISKNGKIINVDNYSGHYHSNEKELMNAVSLLKDMGLEVEKFTYINFYFFN